MLFFVQKWPNMRNFARDQRPEPAKIRPKTARPKKGKGENPKRKEKKRKQTYITLYITTIITSYITYIITLYSGCSKHY